MKRSKWKPLEPPQPRKTVNQKQAAFLQGLQSQLPPSGLERYECGHLVIQPSYLTCIQETQTLDNYKSYHNLSQVVILTASTESNTVPSPEHTSMSPSTLYAAMDLAKPFSSNLSIRPTGSSLFLAGKCSNVSLLSYTGAYPLSSSML